MLLHAYIPVDILASTIIGVKQGGVPSPVLFLIYLDEFLTE